MTDSGWRAIESIKTGERVFSRNDQTGQTGYRRVQTTFTTHNTELVTLTTRTQNSESDTCTVTGTLEHPFWSVQKKCWQPLRSLHAGDTVLTPTGTTATVESMQRLTTPTMTHTYNFCVDGWHTYFVGSGNGSGVWVHNAGKAPCNGKWLADLAKVSKLKPAEVLNEIKTGSFKDLLPHQQYTLWKKATGENFAFPALEKITDWKPKSFDLKQQLWEGRVKIFHKDANEWITFNKGFPDFTEWVGHNLSPQLKAHGEQLIEATGKTDKDLASAWKIFGGKTGLATLKLDELKKNYTWHHTIDIFDGKIKMQMVPKNINTASAGGVQHTGGAAVVKWMMDNGLWKTK